MSACAKRVNWPLTAMLTLVLLLVPQLAMAAEMEPLGERLPVWSIVPFVGMLLSIAIVPLINGEWWENNQGKAAIFWSLVFLIPFTIFTAWEKRCLNYSILFYWTMSPLSSSCLACSVPQGDCPAREIARNTYGKRYFLGHWDLDRLLDRHDRCRHGADSSLDSGQQMACPQETYHYLLHLPGL